MSEEQPRLWDRIKTKLRFWLASAAMRYCGPELIYWIEPKIWDGYMACPICADRRRYEVEEYEAEEYDPMGDIPGHVHDIGDLLP